MSSIEKNMKRRAYMKDYREKVKRRKLLSEVKVNTTNAERCRKYQQNRRNLRSGEVKVKLTNAERCKKYRENKIDRRTEVSKVLWLKKYLKTEFYENLLDEVCDICDRIWFRRDVVCTKIDMYSILNEAVEENFNKTNVTICKTCLSYIRKGKVPRLAKVHGFKFVDIPEHLPELDPIVERLISPRLPFMRLIHLRYSPGSCKIQGQVINVPVDVDEMVCSLPRNLDDDVTFNVSIKRHLLHKSTYLSGCVKKRDVFSWLEALSQTELYKENNIKIRYQDIEDQYSDDDEKIFEYRRNLLDELEDDGTGEGLMSTYQETVFWSDDMVLNIAPGQHNTPIPLSYDLHAEELSFPAVYFGTRRNFTYAVSPFQVMTSEIRRSDRRAVKQNHILYKATKLLRDRFTEGLQRVFKRGGDEYQTITRDDLENNARIHDFMERDLAFFRSIPNSIQYWQMKKSDLFAMIRQLGKPTIFLTLSASEIYWPELMRLLYKYRYPDQEENSFDFENSSVAMRTLMVNEDPVITCLYFDKLIDTIMRALKTKKNGPFGQHYVIDYFKRVEFQHRGSPHVHTLLWLQNAPNEAVSEDMPQTVALINSLMTTNINELFSERISIQIHRHTHTCYKNNKKKCRFGIPFWPMQETRILLPTKEQDTLLKRRYTSIHSNLSSQQDLYHTFEDFLEHNDIWSEDEYLEILRHGIDRPTVFLKRDVHDCFVNAFNPALSAIIDSNMDIQYILDEYSCAAYVAEYVNKSNRGFSSLHRELIKLRNEFPDMDYDDCLKEVGKKSLANIEMCSQEAAWILLRLEMSRASRKTEFIPTQHPSQRILCHKTKQQMDNEGLASTSTDIWLQNKIQYYEHRPAEYHNLCLADFTAKYDKVICKKKRKIDDLNEIHDADENCEDLADEEDEPVQLSISSINYRKRTFDKIVKWTNYHPTTDNLNYKREMVTLFYPFQNEELDLLDDDKYLTIFDSYQSELLNKRSYYEKELDITKMSLMLENLQGNGISAPMMEETNQPLVRNIQPLETSANEDIKTIERISVVRKRDNRMTNETFCQLIRSTTIKQKELIFEYINRLLYEPENKLKIFLTGPAGTGKTFLLKILMECTNRFSKCKLRNTSRNMYLATATTGKAAIGIDGTTVHAAFRINTIRNKNSMLSSQAIHSMRCEFRDLETIFIDEISMLGQNNLKLVDERLRSTSSNLMVPFGDYHIIVCGDLRQLPPVNAKPVYERPANLLQCNMAWQSLNYFPLTEVVRQKDVIFSSLLTKLGNGDKITTEERILLEGRFTNYDDIPEDAIRLYHCNKDVDNYNQNVLNVHGSITVKAKDDVTGCEEGSPQYQSTLKKLDKLDVMACGGMPKSLTLVINAPYLVTQNIDKADRIVNGAVGKLRYIEYSTENPTQIVRLWLQMDDDKCGIVQTVRNRAHTQRLGISTKLVPFNRRDTPILLRSTIIRVRRTQFPLVPSNALTIHKSQGGSYDTVALEYSKSLDISLVYVGLSRARTLEGLYLTNKNGDFKFYHGSKSSSRIKLKTELTRLSGKKLSTCVQKVQTLFENNIANLLYMNVQSVKAHKTDLEIDPVAPHADLLVLAETWMHDNKPPELIKGFNLIARKKREHKRAGGVAIYHSSTSQLERCDAVDMEYCNNIYADVCCSRLQYGSGKHVAVIVIYVSIDTPTMELHKLFDDIMRQFCNADSSVSNIWSFNDATPLVIYGDLNLDFSSSGNKIMLEYLKKKHNLIPAVSTDMITTREGTSIDYVFTKNANINILPYVSYFTYHRPFATALN